MFSSSRMQTKRVGKSFRLLKCRAKAMTRKKADLRVECLEERTQPSVWAAATALGSLSPSSQVAFDTTNGTYEVDYGPWQSGGALDSGATHSTMLFSFSTI